MKKAYAYVIISNRFGGWTPAALAERLGMKLMATGDFGGWCTPDQVEEIRNANVNFRLTAYKFDK